MNGTRWVRWGRGLLVLAMLAVGWRAWPRFDAARSFYAEPGLRSLESAARRVPDDPGYHFRLGVALRDLPAAMDLDRARSHLEEAVELNPHRWRFRRELALLHELSGKIGDAEASYLESIRLNPGSADYRWRVANFYTRAGSLEKALPHFKLALGADPRLRPSAFQLLLRSGAGLEAIESAWPESPAAREDLARLICELSHGERPAGYDSAQAICSTLD